MLTFIVVKLSEWVGSWYSDRAFTSSGKVGQTLRHCDQKCREILFISATWRPVSKCVVSGAAG